MNGIPSTRAEFARIAFSNGRRRNAIAAKDGRLTRIGMCTSEHIELKIEGMHCDGYVRKLTAFLEIVDCVLVEEVGASVTLRL